jgi:cyanophycinase
MSGWLAMVGGAEFTPPCTFDRTLLDHSAADEVLILPTAAAYEHPGRLVDRGIEWFASLGATARGLELLTRPHALDPAIEDTIRAAKFIYLAGGSPMHLRSVLAHSPAWDAIVEAWEGGAVVAGSVAGAQVLGDPMVDSRGGAFTLGLGLVKNVAVIPQHDQWSIEALHRTRVLSQPGMVLFGVDEATAAIRHPDGHWTAEGAGQVTVHVGGEPATIDRLHV